jgi:ubiquinone/menaquinone biosynthesis C-methylase UbiE
MESRQYIMESDDEALRLDLKTDARAFRRQMIRAGIKPGMAAADLGCGSGKTSYLLRQLVGSEGSVSGFDFSGQRIDYARKKYGSNGIEYHRRDIRTPWEETKRFDFVLVRFVLEYYRSSAFDIAANASRLLRPGGILVLTDLDHNCLSHYGLPERLEGALFGLMNKLQAEADFDPYMGRKLYSFLYDLGLSELDAAMEPHHLFFGAISESDAFNWTKKVEVAARLSGYSFPEYGGDFQAFVREFRATFFHPRRFTYTPVMCCRGRKP